MARSVLGSLVVSLGLEAAEFTAGLTKAEYDAKKFKQQLESGLKDAATGVGIALGVIVTAAVAAAVAFDGLVKSAARFKDLEEITGANAESLASFAVSAGTAGTEMASIAEFSVRLTKNLTGVDDESKKAGAALTALGIPIKEFKALDPAAQIEALSKALAKFADDQGKTAVMEALAKGASHLLPFVKQLNEDGGRQVILTQQQIDVADTYADAQARLKTEIQLYAQATASEAVPAIMAFTKVAKDAVVEVLGLKTGINGLTVETKQGILDWASTIVQGVANVITVIEGFSRTIEIVGLAIGNLAATLASPTDFANARRLWKEFQSDLDEISSRKFFGDRVRQAIADAKQMAGFAGTGETGGPPSGKPRLKEPAATSAGKAQKEATDQAAKYLEQLERQLEKTEELSTVEKVLNDILKERITFIKGGISPGQLLDVAKRIDDQKALAAAIKEREKVEDDARRTTLKNIEGAQRERDNLLQSNVALKEHIEEIGKTETELRALDQTRLDNIIAIKEQEAAQKQLNGASTEEVSAIRDQINALRDRKGLLSLKGQTEDIAAEAAKAKRFADDLGSALAQGAEDAILHFNNLRDVLKNLEQDLLRIITRKLITQPLGDFFSNLIGGSSGGGGLLAGIFGGAHAFGGSPPVGKVSIVGERGPELFIPKTAGNIIPNSALNARRAERGNVTVNTTVNVPGNTSRATADQIGVRVAAAVQRAMRKAG